MRPKVRNHQIYTGSFAALERRWVDMILELREEDPLREIHVLVGSNLLASYLKRRLAGSGRIAANVRFHTFLDLVHLLAFSIDRSREKPRLPRLGPSILLEDLLEEKTPRVYESLSGYRGFRDALLGTFRDLRDAGFSARDLNLVIRRSHDTDRHEHLLGLADLYSRYRERVGHFRDVDDDFRDAIRDVTQHEAPQSLHRLLVYGIYDVTGQQSTLLRAMKDSVDLAYFIPFVDASVSEFARPFVDGRAAELEVSPIHLSPAGPTNSLESLAAGAFGFSGRDTGRCADDGSFALVSVPGESRAAVEILREVFRAVQDGTIRGFHEAAVILRQPETDIPILVEVFRLRGIPCFVQGGLRLADRPLGKAVLALSRLGAVSYTREAVLAAMELVAAAQPEGSHFEWDVQGWRALTNDARFLVGLESWDSGTKALEERQRAKLAGAESGPDDAAADEDEGPARTEEAARRQLESASLLRDAWQQIRGAAADWPSSFSWEDWADLLEQRFKPLLGSAQDWESFSSILDDLGGMRALRGFGDSGPRSGNVPLERLRSALAEAVLSHTCPVGQFQRSGINLLSTSSSRGLRFPLVLIPGLDEGRFPARLRQDPLLLDAERLRMGTLPVKSKRIDEEKLLFDMAARSAEKRLILIASRLDEGSDRERIPSQFFLRAASAVRGGAVTIRDLSEGAIAGFRSVSLDSPAPAKDQIPVDEGEIRLRIVTADRKSANAAVRALAELDPMRFRRPLQFDQARWKPRLTPFDGFISDPSLIQWLRQILGSSAGQVSASRLEEYAKCPYFFFLKRAMDLQPWEEEGKVEGMDPRDRGNLVHSILEKFLRDLGEEVFHSDVSRLRKSLQTRAGASLDQARPAGIPDLLWDIERDGLMAVLHSWLEYELNRADPEMLVARLEQVFGKFKQLDPSPAYTLQAGRHTFEFRGRIDRVDLSRDRTRARVVDYKTGYLPESMANKGTRTPLMSGERIQLLVYAGALSVLEEYGRVESVEGEYLHLQPKNGLTVPCAFTPEEMRKAGQSLPEILEMIGDGIENGVFFARTKGKVRPSGHCEYCDYLEVCGKDRERREERKAADPLVQQFTKTLETL